jgi:ligand-binding SRPBCC domain-containing protein
MPRLKAAIDIEATREHVFAAADPSKMSGWTTHIKEIVITAGDGRSAGTMDTTIIKVGPRRNKLQSTWIEYNPGEAFARTFTGYFEGQERMTFVASDGGTHVQWDVNYTPPFGILGRFGAWFMMARIFQNELEASLDRLKSELET